MRNIRGLVEATLLCAGPTFAADLPVKAPSAVPPGSVLSRNGWYIGANAGWVGSMNDTITNPGTETRRFGLGSDLAFGLIPTSLSVGYSGFI